MGKKSSSAPDVAGAARAEAAANRETQRDITYSDRPDQYNPFSSVGWTNEQVIDPATGEPVNKWTQNQTFTPGVQNVIDQQLSQMGGRGQLGAGMMNRIQSEMGGAPDWAQFGQAQGLDYDPSQIRQGAEDAAYKRSTNRLDPQYAQQEQAMEVKLRNQGLRPGDEAYNASMSNFTTGKTDAYEQARLGASATGMQEAGQLWDQQLQGNQLSNQLRSDQIQEYLSKRGFSLGEQGALSQGQTLTDLLSATGGE
jgi:hypothetical protein